MGSGRGQSRRAPAATGLAGAGGAVDVDKWAAFVKDQNIGKIRVVDYYKVEFPKGVYGLPIAAPLAELATEFFRDLVEVGAITLPAHVDADDFEFNVRIIKLYASSDYETHMLVMRNKKTNDEHECSETPHQALHHKANLDDYSLPILARAMGMSAALLSTPGAQ